MLEIEEAQKILADQLSPIIETEDVPLLSGYHRILAKDVAADRDQPPFPRSPLDGYAVRSEDIKTASKDSPITLDVIGKIYAGYVFDGVVKAGQAVRLMTGSPIPDGANAVIRQEDTDLGETKVNIYTTVSPYGNYCFQGEDYKAGTTLLHQYDLLDPGKLTVLSSLGKDQLCVYKQPKIAILSTGDEVIAPGSAWQPGKIYDSNRAYIHTALERFHITPIISKHIPDEAENVANEIKEAAKACDMIITTGGVSVGEKDIMHAVAQILPATRLFWRVRIKPGSPTLAFTYEGTPVLALSGNPYGAIVNFEFLARPMLAKLCGCPQWMMKQQTAILKHTFKKSAGTRRFLRGRYENGQVFLCDQEQASGSIASMAGCNCFVEISVDMAGAAEGDTVKVHLL